MAARVSFLSSALDPKHLSEPPKKIVPGPAVANRDGAKVVYVLDAGRVRMVAVRLGPPFAGGFELLDGPEPGTKIIRDPAATLRDGQAVKERRAQ